MNYWLVNTYSKEGGLESAYKKMLRQGMVATFQERIESIEKLEVGDIVFLYHNENRIIAVGAVIGNYEEFGIKKIDKTMHQIDVNWFWKAKYDDNFVFSIDNCINKNDIGGNDWSVLHAVNKVTPDCEKLLEQIAKKQQLSL